MKDKFAELTAQLARIIKYESTAFTQNSHYLSDSKERFLAQYKAARAQVKPRKARVGHAQEAAGSESVSTAAVAPVAPVVVRPSAPAPRVDSPWSECYCYCWRKSVS